jgi:uncharacterized membrane protein
MTLETALLNIFGSKELVIIFVAALPIFELRGSIPLALFTFGFDPYTAFFLSVIGNMIPVIPLLLFLEPVSNYLRQWRIWDIFFSWLFERTHRKHSADFEKYGSIGLAIFVGIPLPATGAWTGCAAAFIFGFKFKNSFLAILAGVIIAGVLVTALAYMGNKIFI